LQITINQTEIPVAVGLRKCDGLTSSAPEKDDCGLAVDINHISDMSTGNVLAPIECLVNDTLLHTRLFQNGYQLFCCITIRNTTLSTL
jgi:hypothetical protein